MTPHDARAGEAKRRERQEKRKKTLDDALDRGLRTRFPVPIRSR